MLRQNSYETGACAVTGRVLAAHRGGSFAFAECATGLARLQMAVASPWTPSMPARMHAASQQAGSAG